MISRRSDRKISSLFISIFLLLLASIAQADFVADQFVTLSQGELMESQQLLTAKVYSQGKKVRMEMMLAGRKSISISRGDKKPPVFWMLMPQEKMYMETTGEVNSFAPPGPNPDIKPEKVFVAKEPVAGRPTNKFKITWKDKEGNRRTGFAWEAIELNDAPIRQEFFHKNEHVLVQLINIEVKKLDPNLFEVPDGFKKFAMPPGAEGPASPAPPTPKP